MTSKTSRWPFPREHTEDSPREAGTESQPDIGDDVQKGIRKANERDDAAGERQDTLDSPEGKATQFDGNPNPQGEESGLSKPRDDTPAVLRKRSGPRNPS